MPSITNADDAAGERRLLVPAALLFFASGFAALLYQVLWQRILGIFSGVHIYSITLIVTAFMAGLGFGSLLGGRLADRLGRRTAVAAFAACELGIGLFALISPWLYYDVAYLELGWLVHWPLALPAVHLALLLGPTLLMGASLPLLARGLVLRTETAARTVGVLYGINALGAAAGALCAAWSFIGAIGFVWTIRAGALLNLAVAAGGVLLGRRVPVDARGAAVAARGGSEPAAADPPGAFRLRTWCVLYALSGFVALSLELVWFRVLDVAIKASPYTFGHLLGLFLGFLAAGSLAGALWLAEVRRPALAFLWGQWCISVSGGLTLLALWALPERLPLLRSWHAYWGDAMRSFEMVELVRALDSGDAGVLAWAAQLYLVLPVVLLAVPTFLMGLTFTWIQRAVQTDIEVVGWRVGAVQTANIAGSILGSLLTGALFLGLLGTPRTLALLLATGGVFGLLAGLRLGGRTGRLAAAVAVAASLLLAVALPGPAGFWLRFHGARPGSLIVAEDASGVAALQTISSGFAVLRVNGKMHSNLPFRSIHTVLGLVPGLVHPEIRRALVIGLGSGTTAWAVAAAAPGLERLDVYEIVEPEIDVLQAYRRESPVYPALEQLLDDPRIRLTWSDGRLALRTEPGTYDLIEADALDPSMAFSGNLYSQEFFELCRSRLSPGGILVTYVPTERTRRTVLSVFPWALDFHAPGQASFIIAAERPLAADRETLLGRLGDPRVQAYLAASGEAGPVTRLVAGYLAQAEIVPVGPDDRGRDSAGDTNRDLFPRDEFDKRYDGTYQ